MMNSFIWKGKDSYIDYGIVISVLPSSVKPERNVDEIEIQGRSGDLTIDYGTYKSITFILTCTLLDATKIESIKGWLDGIGDLVFSWKNNRRYEAKMINMIDISQSLETFGEFPLIFKCQPFGYSTTNNIITLTSSGQGYDTFAVNNTGSTSSRPIITLFGSGQITLGIHGKNITLDSITDYVTIDSKVMDCYKDTVLRNSHMVGDFPELLAGNNNFVVNGTYSRVEIIPNFRYL